MGAAVGLLLASGLFGTVIASVFALGMKVDWSPEEVARMGKIPAMRVFASRGEAGDRFLRVTGLQGIAAIDAACVNVGVAATDGGFRLAADPRTVSVAGVVVRTLPDCGQTIPVPVRYARGSADPIVAATSLQALDPDSVDFPGHGHNVHVSDPSAVVDALCNWITTVESRRHRVR